MKKLMIATLVLCALGGCSHRYHPLDSSKKAQLVSEIINGAPRCRAFKESLASPTVNDDAIDAIYHEATKAQCIQKDI